MCECILFSDQTNFGGGFWDFLRKFWINKVQYGKEWWAENSTNIQCVSFQMK